MNSEQTLSFPSNPRNPQTLKNEQPPPHQIFISNLKSYPDTALHHDSRSLHNNPFVIWPFLSSEESSSLARKAGNLHMDFVGTMTVVSTVNLRKPLITEPSPALMHGSSLRVTFQGVPGVYSVSNTDKAFPGYDATTDNRFEMQVHETFSESAAGKDHPDYDATSDDKLEASFQAFECPVDLSYTSDGFLVIKRHLPILSATLFRSLKRVSSPQVSDSTPSEFKSFGDQISVEATTLPRSGNF